MHNLSVAYRGFSLLPFAAFDAGGYASILVIEDSERRRRSTGARKFRRRRYRLQVRSGIRYV